VRVYSTSRDRTIFAEPAVFKLSPGTTNSTNHKHTANADGMAKRLQGRPPKAAPVASRTTDTYDHLSSVEEPDIDSLLVGNGARDAKRQPMTTVPYAMKTEAPEKASAVGSLVWRGGLNQRLAEIISQEYHRIVKPVPVTAKMAVYREWGVMLGIAAADGDGSRLRKAVTRLLKDFDRAYAVMEAGDGDEHLFLRMCPEFHVLLPVLRPRKSGSSRSPRIHGQGDDKASRGATRVSKRQRDEEPQDVLKSREKNTNVGDGEMDSTAPPRKRRRATQGSAIQVLLDDFPAPPAGALDREPPSSELTAVPRIPTPFEGHDAQVVTEKAESAAVVKQGNS
jgi:hypothetical protein